MFEGELLDEEINEEIKKKKRRVIVLLFMLLLLGMVVAFPLAKLSPPAAMPVSEAVVETPAHTATVTRPTPAPVGTATSVPAPEIKATVTSPLEATPSPQATATAAVVRLTPAVTEETTGGFGGGGQIVSSTATSTPTDTSLTLATPTLMEPAQLPASGAEGSRKLGPPVLGLAAILLGTLMMGAGCALQMLCQHRRS